MPVPSVRVRRPHEYTELFSVGGVHFLTRCTHFEPGCDCLRVECADAATAAAAAADAAAATAEGNQILRILGTILVMHLKVALVFRLWRNVSASSERAVLEPVARPGLEPCFWFHAYDHRGRIVRTSTHQ